MVQILSKLKPIYVTCDHMHPWSDSCLEVVCGSFFYTVKHCLKLYGVFYLFSLVVRRNVFKKNHVKQVLIDWLRSTAFVSSMSVTFWLCWCGLRRILGHYNFLTIAAVPMFVACCSAVPIERQSRRKTVSMYISNIALHALWKMAVSRNLVRPIKHGEVYLVSVCTALLFFYYKSDLHKAPGKDKNGLIFDFFRYIEGSCQESSGEPTTIPSNQNKVHGYFSKFLWKLKGKTRLSICPHPFSCSYYTLQGALSMFGIGLIAQNVLKIVLNIKEIGKSPKAFVPTLFARSTLPLALFLGSFSGIIRGVNCVLRKSTGTNKTWHALVAGLLVGVSFTQFPNNTLIIYLLFQMIQTTWNVGVSKDVLPRLPHFATIMLVLSTCFVYHVIILEPSNIRPSYWKFVHLLNGGRLACINRKPLDVWGLETSRALLKMLEKTNTRAVTQNAW